METAIILYKKLGAIFSNHYIMRLILVLMFIWTVINVLYGSQLYDAGMFCALGVPLITAVMGKKYGMSSAAVGLIWFVFSLRVLIWEFFIK